MVRLITRGRFTLDYAKGLVAAPEDREPVVRKLIEAVGDAELEDIIRRARDQRGGSVVEAQAGPQKLN